MFRYIQIKNIYCMIQKHKCNKIQSKNLVNIVFLFIFQCLGQVCLCFFCFVKSVAILLSEDKVAGNTWGRGSTSFFYAPCIRINIIKALFQNDLLPFAVVGTVHYVEATTNDIVLFQPADWQCAASLLFHITNNSGTFFPTFFSNPSSSHVTKRCMNIC